MDEMKFAFLGGIKMSWIRDVDSAVAKEMQTSSHKILQVEIYEGWLENNETGNGVR